MIDRSSLRWRAPAIIALILIGAVATLSVLAYTAARGSAIDVARERLDNAANQVGAIAGTGVINLKRIANEVSADSAIVAALRQPGSPLTPKAVAALEKLRTDTTLPLKVAVLDREGRPVEGIRPELSPELPVERFALVDSATISPFRTINGVLEYMVAAPVRDSGRVIGQVVQWRRVTRVTASLRLISDLIGDSALLMIGNNDGTAVTELSDTLRPPLIRDSARARSARELHTSAAAPIPGTPWAWYVEYPNAIILRPLRLLTWQTVLVSLLVLVLGIIAGALVSRGMTTSLADLTTTAESIAAGDFSRYPEAVRRGDEIGRLARSFSIMADRIRDSRDQLEKRIEVRTADLQRAMTQLRETQDELVRKEKLATIGQLASSVGHELRNPLGVMSNAAYIIERSLESQPAKAQEYLKVLNAQIRLSERIVTDLLDSARSPSPQRRLVDVRSMVNEHLRRVTVPKNIRVDVAIDQKMPQVHVDPDQIGQILVNLFMNAAQAMGNKPGALSVYARNGDGRVRIEVRDTGPGVPDDLADKIFEPLFTTKARGIGLGLAVSRSLAVANSGALLVANHPEGGAVFTLDLPVGGAT
jgi:C4-dicarboxylate-specific signal transduction histidine kinase